MDHGSDGQGAGRPFRTNGKVRRKLVREASSWSSEELQESLIGVDCVLPPSVSSGLHDQFNQLCARIVVPCLLRSAQLS